MNEERILSILEQLVAGQAKLEFGQAKLESGQAKLEDKLESGQAKIESRLAKLESGQAKLESEFRELKALQRIDFDGIGSMIADTHETIVKHQDEANKKLDDITKSINSIKQITTRNVYDIAELQTAMGAN
jgi:peptidoglycan hydrolase CwlO-like protein